MISRPIFSLSDSWHMPFGLTMYTVSRINILDSFVPSVTEDQAHVL